MSASHAAAIAAELYETMVALAETGSLMRTWDYRLIATLLGMSAACAREWDAADAHFREALRLARELPMRVEESDASRFSARMLIARNRAGDREAARALMQKAATGYATLVMPQHEAMAREFLLSLDDASPATSSRLPDPAEDAAG